MTFIIEIGEAHYGPFESAELAYKWASQRTPIGGVICLRELRDPAKWGPPIVRDLQSIE